MSTATVLVTAAVTGPGWLATAWHAARLSRKLHTDRLTGLPNRDALRRAFDRASRRSLAVGVLLLDLDGFKAVNDTHGHDAGNAVLRHVGRQLSFAAPRLPRELPVRLHGDEFAVLLGELPTGAAGLGAARKRADQIAAALATPMVWGETELAVTASIGVAVATTPSAELPALMRVADQRMYASKRHADAAAAAGQWS